MKVWDIARILQILHILIVVHIFELESYLVVEDLCTGSA